MYASAGLEHLQALRTLMNSHHTMLFKKDSRVGAQKGEFWCLTPLKYFQNV